MGTVNTCGLKVRRKLGKSEIEHFNQDILDFLNEDILVKIYQSLVNVGSNLVYGIGDVTTEADVAEYTPSFSFDGFLRDGSWVDGEDTYLSQVSETDKIKWDYSSTTNQPEAFYITEDGKIGYLWVPDGIYTIHHAYWKPLVALTDYEADDLPWGGVWNATIQRLLLVEMLEFTEEDPNKIIYQTQMAGIEWDKAMSMVYQRGIKQERQLSNMFSAEGS